MKTLAALAVFLVLTVVSVRAQTTTDVPAGNTSGEAADRAAVEYVIRDSVSEIQACRLAESHASDPHVRQFCRTMIREHRQMIGDAQNLGRSIGLGPEALRLTGDESGQIALSVLATESGAEFDQDFMRDQVSDHQNDIKTMRDAAKAASNPSVKAFDRQAVERLSHHLELAQATLAAIR